MPTQLNLIGSGCAPLQALASVGISTAASLSITAAGASQGTAAVIGTDFNVVTTAAASIGVILPPCGTTGNQFFPGDTIFIANHGANSLSVYPPVGGKIANGATNAALALAATKSAVYQVVGVNLYAASVSA
jgi:hypothetical protein